MNPLARFVENLMRKGIYPFEKIIADGDPHQFTDARSGRRYIYTIYQNYFRLIELTCRVA